MRPVRKQGQRLLPQRRLGEKLSEELEQYRRRIGAALLTIGCIPSLIAYVVLGRGTEFRGLLLLGIALVCFAASFVAFGFIRFRVGAAVALFAVAAVAGIGYAFAPETLASTERTIFTPGRVPRVPEARGVFHTIFYREPGVCGSHSRRNPDRHYVYRCVAADGLIVDPCFPREIGDSVMDCFNSPWGYVSLNFGEEKKALAVGFTVISRLSGGENGNEGWQRPYGLELQGDLLCVNIGEGNVIPTSPPNALYQCSEPDGTAPTGYILSDYPDQTVEPWIVQYQQIGDAARTKRVVEAIK